MNLEQALARIVELEAEVARLAEELDYERYPEQPRPVSPEHQTKELEVVRDLIRKAMKNGTGVIHACAWQEKDGEIVTAWIISTSCESVTDLFAVDLDRLKPDFPSVTFRFAYKTDYNYWQNEWLKHEVLPLTEDEQ